MTTDTWNFACHNGMDRGPDVETVRNSHGVLGSLGAGSLPVTTQPFTQTVTAIFSFLHRSGGWSADGSVENGLMSIGKYNGWSHAFSVWLEGSPLKLHIVASDSSADSAETVVYRLQLELGDEDGVNWIQSDKWYQCAISINGSAISWAVNGVTAPTQTVNLNAPGALNLSTYPDRIWIHNNEARAPVFFNPLFMSYGGHTCVIGPIMLRTTYMDFSSATVRNRIWDSDGNFKNPGEDGSLWLSDTYGDVLPEFYMHNGDPRNDVGTYPPTVYNLSGGYEGQWGWANFGGSGHSQAIAGFRKQYEQEVPTELFNIVDGADNIVDGADNIVSTE